MKLLEFHCWYLLLGMACFAGCSICPPGYLDDYATVGGKWQRADPARGRVGSVLSDPGSTVSGETVVDGGTYYGSEFRTPAYEDGYYADPGGEIYHNGYGSSGEYIPADEYSTAPGYAEEVMELESYDTTPPNSYGGSSILEDSR